jgi:molecular chaperone GrpE
VTQQPEPGAAPDSTTGAPENGRDQPAPPSGAGGAGPNDAAERGDAERGDAERGARAAEAAAEAAEAEAERAGTAVAEPEPEQGPAPQPEADVLAADVARLEDRWRRTLADLDNLRKRCAREIERERALERGRVASAWLAIVDNLERALAHADGNAEAVIEGVRAVRDQAVDLLAKLGYPRHDEVGVRFDPARHEAVSVVDASDESDAAPGTVVRVMRPGYGDAEWQLRPASVVVARPRE